MDIYVDANGDAYVTETWNCIVSEGTEVYHPYYNLGNSKIKDLTVSEGNVKYKTLSKWKTSGTLESKANKCGINKISDGVELCWGISGYGSHTYTAKYTITNFVSATTDAQMIYWTLIPHKFSTSIGQVYIKIYTDFNIEDTIDVWGYGNYGGTAYVYDGYIEMIETLLPSIDNPSSDLYLKLGFSYQQLIASDINNASKMIDYFMLSAITNEENKGKLLVDFMKEKYKYNGVKIKDNFPGLGHVFEKTIQCKFNLES
jgi:hypothetical protein